MRTLVIRFISTFIYCDQYCTATIYSATCSARGTHIVYVSRINNQSINDDDDDDDDDDDGMTTTMMMITIMIMITITFMLMMIVTIQGGHECNNV